MAKGLLRGRAPKNLKESTYESPYWIVRFPHEQRFRFAVEEIIAAKPKALLDYGAGDGYLLKLLDDRGALPERVVAYSPVEVSASMSEETIRRHGLDDRATVARSLDECADIEFDCVACLSVLEHLPLPERELFYSTCERQLVAGGVGVVEVPVEIGPSVVVKELARRTLKAREREYTASRLIRRAVGLRERDPQRFDPSNLETWIQHHTNFDHRTLVDELDERFTVRRTYGSPFRRIPAALGNQEVFIVFDR